MQEGVSLAIKSLAFSAQLSPQTDRHGSTLARGSNQKMMLHVRAAPHRRAEESPSRQTCVLSEYSEQQPKIQLFNCKRTPGQGSPLSPLSPANNHYSHERENRDLLHLSAPPAALVPCAGISEEEQPESLEPPQVMVSIKSSKTPTKVATSPSLPASAAELQSFSPGLPLSAISKA